MFLQYFKKVKKTKQCNAYCKQNTGIILNQMFFFYNQQWFIFEGRRTAIWHQKYSNCKPHLPCNYISINLQVASFLWVMCSVSVYDYTNGAWGKYLVGLLLKAHCFFQIKSIFFSFFWWWVCKVMRFISFYWKQLYNVPIYGMET